MCIYIYTHTYRSSNPTIALTPQAKRSKWLSACSDQRPGLMWEIFQLDSLIVLLTRFPVESAIMAETVGEHLRALPWTVYWQYVTSLQHTAHQVPACSIKSSSLCCL